MNKQLFFFSSKPEVVTNDANPSEMKLTGIFCATGVLSFDKGGYRAKFTDGCFKDLNQFSEGADILALRDHDNSPQNVLARTANGSLTLNHIPGVGYSYECVFTDTTDAVNTYKQIQSGLIAGMSFGVEPDMDEDGDVDGYEWSKEGDTYVQTWVPGKSNLAEISFCFQPAFGQTTVSFDVLKQENPSFQKFLNSMEQFEQHADKVAAEMISKMLGDDIETARQRALNLINIEMAR
jgi:phage head maturation protease